MFESICIRRQEYVGAKDPVDISFFAEALLFYQQVHLIADIEMIAYLARQCSPRYLLELIEEGFLRISYLEKGTGIRNYEVGTGLESHEPVVLQHTNRRMALERAAPTIFSTAGAAPGAGRQLGRLFAQLVPTVDLGPDLINAVKEDFADAAYVTGSVERLLNILAPTYRLPSDFYFHLEKVGRGFHVDTNVDFEQANASFNEKAGTIGTTLHAPALLTYLLEARGDLQFAASEKAELATHEAKSAILAVKFQELLNIASNSRRNMEEFQRLVLANSHEIGESLKYNYRTWSEYLALLRKARKFKTWLHEQEPEAALIHEYMTALEKDSWISSTPAKVLRFVVCQALGLVVPGIVNLGISTADSFLLEQLLGGWRPSQFVIGSLKKDFARQDN